MTINNTALEIYHEIVKKINNNTLQLASLPDIIFKVNAVLDDETKGISDIAKVIQHEISLSTRIIHISNSPALRGLREVTSMTDAVNRLGVALIKNLAICVSLKDKFNTKNMVHKDLMDETMDISLQRSAYGFLIAKYLVLETHPEISLISGLVSKVGHAVMLRYINDSPDLKKLPEEEVRNIINQYGDEISEVILSRWSFPAAILESLYGRTLPNTRTPSTYQDVYQLSLDYIEYKAGRLNETEMLKIIDTVVEAHLAEYESLISLLG